jgi:hypothetical protein
MQQHSIIKNLIYDGAAIIEAKKYFAMKVYTIQNTYTHHQSETGKQR